VCIGYSSSILIDSDVSVLFVRDTSLFMISSWDGCKTRFGVHTVVIEIF
jgi:hypothetical protein